MEAFCHHDWKRAGEAASAFVGSGLAKFIAPFHPFAKRLVDACWPAIEAVASAVGTRQRLTGVETVAVVIKHLDTALAKDFHDKLTTMVDEIGKKGVEAPQGSDACARCGHRRTWHTEETIPAGRFGAGGRCGWWKDPMFFATEECSCTEFEEQSEAD